MLSSVHDRIPELYPYYYSAYSQASCLFFGQYIILSGQGPQQGDPIGPLLFSNTLHPTLSSLKASLNLGYLDDITLGDTQTVVAADVKEVTEKGLSLNVDKCELITHKDTQMDDDILRSFNRVELEEATLLGAPLLSGSVLDSTRDDRCADLARACDRLSSPSAQDALILLRSSFSAPRVMHLLRCSSSTNHPALSKFDDILKVSIQRTVTFPICSGYRPASQCAMEVLEFDGLLRWHFCLFGFSRKHLVTPSRHFVFMYSIR